MSITVVIARDDAGAPSTREVFETGVKFMTEGGDLSILSGRPQLLATYGSGNWLSVYVDDNVTVLTEKPADESSDDSSFDFDSFGDDSSSSEESTGGAETGESETNADTGTDPAADAVAQDGADTSANAAV
jgi:hypothetical protein